jgi:predicted O-methyltransferase YrrM
MHALQVPGWMHPKDLDVIKTLAACIPPSGIIVEVGSWLGQSTCAWAEHTQATIYAIDLWQWMPKTYQGHNADKVDLKGDPFRQFQQNVNRYANVVPLRRPSSGGEWTWGSPDLVFIDAMHQDPYVNDDVLFWERHLRKGGILCGDDYSPKFPAVMEAAKACAARFNAPLQLPGQKFWLVETL